MLNLRPYMEEIEEIEPGQTVRINHTDCEAGEDTRRRLYLTRTHADETKVVAYCHNCQEGGFYSDNVYQHYRATKHTVPSNTREEDGSIVTEPVGLIPKLSDWPADAQAWAISRGLAQVDIDWYGIKYDPSTDRVYLPRYEVLDRREDTKSEVVGYQLRSLHNWDKTKYLTVQSKDAKNYTFCYPEQDNCDWIVIVEDLISAIHVLRATDDGNLPGVVINYGTKVDPTLMYTIANSFKWCTVWLDNDNQHVINQAKIMQRTIKMYSDKIKVARVEDYNDPKYHDHKEIVRILDEVNYG